MNKPDPFMEGYHLGHKHGRQHAYAVSACIFAAVFTLAGFVFFL